MEEKNSECYTIYESHPYRTPEEKLELVKDFCEDNEIEVPEEDSNEWWDIINEHEEMYSHDFWDYVKSFDRIRGTKVVIWGVLGLWDGPRYVEANHDDLYSAVSHCIARDIDEVKAYEDEKGNFFLDCIHHDGTNHFRIVGPRGGALKFAGVVFGRKYPRKRRAA